MNILVRLPNWLGDMVMSIGFIDALQKAYPEASVSVIAKKGIHTLLEFFPPTSHQFIFSKEEYPGIQGVWRFGKVMKQQEDFDLFFCLPDSFSSALMGFAAGAKKRIGYKNELRDVLLTNAYRKRGQQHRVREYIDLLDTYTGKTTATVPVRLVTKAALPEDRIIINVNSEAVSRRLPLEKAIALLSALRKSFSAELVLIGGKGDAPFVETILAKLPDTNHIINKAGKTSLPELVALVASSKILLTTDSGPAHVANAAGVPVVVLFGAGNENNTAPYNEADRIIIRLGKLPCEPCVKNKCVLYGIPKCMELLDEQLILDNVRELYSRSSVHL